MVMPDMPMGLFRVFLFKIKYIHKQYCAVVKKGENLIMGHVYKRGEIYYIYPSGSEHESEQVAGRPAIIVSNNKGNGFSPVVEVVFLTTKEKNPLPTHVEILSCKRPSIALCEQIDTVSKSRIGKYNGKCTDEEMHKIDKAICVSVGIAQKDNGYDSFLKLIDELSKLRDNAMIKAEAAECVGTDEYWSGFSFALEKSICMARKCLEGVTK